MNIAIEKTKEYIKKQVKIDRVSLINEPFSKYQKVYLSTNENIKEYLDLVSFKNKTNALTVLASGDHAFNLITKGILNIDTFDTNILTTYYVFGLKYAMILKYSYKEYLNILSILTNKQTNLELITTIIKDLLPYMDLKYRNYWNEIIDYNYNIQKDKSNHINIIYLLFMNIYSIDKIMMPNNYLLNEDNYNILKSNLYKSNIKFKNVNAFDLDKNYFKEYDFILLSNILDYFANINQKFNIEDLRNYEKRLFNILKCDGTIFLKYIMDYSYKDFTTSFIIRNSRVKKEDLDKETIYKINAIPSIYGNNYQDGIVLGKKY